MEFLEDLPYLKKGVLFCFVLLRQIAPNGIHFKNLGFQHPASSSGTYFHNWEVRMDRLSPNGRELVSSFYLFIFARYNYASFN